jgi:hypothetical protein
LFDRRGETLYRARVQAMAGVEVMTERCQTCKHWGAGISMQFHWAAEPEFLETEEGEYGHKVCALTVTHGGYTDGPREGTNKSRMLAYSDAYDGEPRGLWTLPAFGCVQWEQD